MRKNNYWLLAGMADRSQGTDHRAPENDPDAPTDPQGWAQAQYDYNAGQIAVAKDQRVRELKEARTTMKGKDMGGG